MKTFLNVMPTLCFVIMTGISSQSANAFVDLHAHPFLIDQMFWGGKAGFTEGPTSTSWRDRYQTRLTEKNILNSGVNVMVVSFYAHPLFKDSVAKGLRQSIRSQIDQLHRFVRQHSDEVEVALSPTDVKRITDQKKLALVLSIEGASGVFDSSKFEGSTTDATDVTETDRNFEEFIIKEGIRIVTLEHFIDDELGGAAFFPTWRGLLANPVSFVDALWTLLVGHRFSGKSIDEVMDKNGIFINKNGLSLKGYDLIQRLVRQGVWIDLSHSSDKTIEDFLKIKEVETSPLLFTHTALRKNFPAERGLSDEMLRKVAEKGGLIGLIPSEEMLTKTKFEGSEERRFEDCFGGVKAFQAQWIEMLSVLVSKNEKKNHQARVLLGSDANAPLQFLSNFCLKDSGNKKVVESISKNGFTTYSDVSVLFDLMSEKNENEIISFVEIWQNYLDSIRLKSTNRK